MSRRRGVRGCGRRSTGGLPPFDPIMLDPLAYWRAESGVDTTSGMVWTDIASGLVIAQAAGASCPTFVASDANFGGKPTVSFSGSQWLVSDLPASAWGFLHKSAMTALVAFRASSALSSLTTLISTKVEGDTGHGLHFRGTYASWGNGTQVNATTSPSGGTLATNQTGWAMIKWTGAVGGAQVNYRQSTQAANTSTAWANAIDTSDPDVTLQVGQTGSAGRRITGQIAEIILLDRRASDAEVQSTAGYFARKYGAAA